MTATATAKELQASVSNGQVKAVKAYTDSLSTTPGYRKGETTTPTANLVTFEVSAWTQVPQILKALETHGGEGLKLNFPKGSDPASIAKAAALQAFFEKFHSKPCSEMLTELAKNIETSGDLASANAKIGWLNKIGSGEQWIAALKLDKLAIQDKLKVTNVVDVATSATGTVNPSIFVQAKASVAAGRQVVYQLDGSQGAASALYRELSAKGAAPVDPKTCSIWSGSAMHYPKAENPEPVQAVALNDFLEKERRKAPILKALHKITAPHSHGYELAKIKTWELEQKDRNGVSVLDNLKRILKAPDLKGVTSHLPVLPPDPKDVEEWRALLLASAIERLYHPGKANQDQHGTCGAESIIRLVGKVSVGEWSRVVADLVVDGESKISPSINLKPADDWTLTDMSKSRDAFDALLQSAFMRRAAERLGFNYRNSDDSFIDASGAIQYQLDSRGRKIQERDGTGKKLYEADGKTPKWEKLNGMLDDCAAELISGLLSQDHEPVNAHALKRTFGKDYALKLAELASKTGGIYIALTWGGGGHAVVLTGYDQATDRFIFSNPHGTVSGKSDGDRIPGSAEEPERYIINNEFGVQGMSRKVFEKMLQSALMPKA